MNTWYIGKNLDNKPNIQIGDIINDIFGKNYLVLSLIQNGLVSQNAIFDIVYTNLKHWKIIFHLALVYLENDNLCNFEFKPIIRQTDKFIIKELGQKQFSIKHILSENKIILSNDVIIRVHSNNSKWFITYDL